MTSDLDIYRSANLLVKQHGEDAPIQAAMRACANCRTAIAHSTLSSPVSAECGF